MVKILQKENKTLRKTAKEISFEKISSKEIKKILKDMSIALASQKDGVAIAAPQINVSLRIFVVAGKIFGENIKDVIFINPKIIKLSKMVKELPEGCLSVRWLYGKVKRSDKITITAYDKNGKKFQRGASGLLAQIFQHEMDHLNGILFIDKAKDVKEIKPENNSNN